MPNLTLESWMLSNGHAKIFELFSTWNSDSIVKWEGVCIKRQTITTIKIVCVRQWKNADLNTFICNERAVFLNWDWFLCTDTTKNMTM